MLMVSGPFWLAGCDVEDTCVCFADQPDAFVLYAGASGECIMLTGRNDTMLRYVCRAGAVAVYDTLRRNSNGLFVSKRHRSLFFLEKDHVTRIDTILVVHPSSNWQGQTPGAEIVRAVYRRIK